MIRDRVFIITSVAIGTALLACILCLMFVVFVEPLPFPDSGRLVTVASMDSGTATSNSLADYNDFSRQGSPFDNSIFIKGIFGDIEINGHPESLFAVNFQGNLFSVFQKAPLLGNSRDLNSRQERDGCAAIISYSAWTRFFGQDSKVLGRTIHVGKKACEVIAVLPPEYEIVLPADLWVPFQTQGAGNRGNRDGRIYARLPSIISAAEANAYLRTVAASLQKQAPDTNEGISFVATPIKDSLAGHSKPLLYLMGLGAAVVLCVAYFNAYQLLAAKAVAASPRWSLCLALGATRKRLLWDIFKGPLLLSLVGNAAGIFLGALAVDVLRNYSPADIPRIGDARLVWQIVLALFLMSIFAAALFTSAMLARILSLETTTSLHGAARAGASIRHAFSAKKQSLLFAQITLGTSLLICMGMLGAALRQAVGGTLGFKAEGVSITSIYLKEPTNTPSGGEYARELMQRLATLPAVQEVGMASSVPFQGRSYRATFLNPEMGESNGKELEYTAISPQVFKALQLRLIAGRLFLDSDDNNHPKVAVLNRAAAQTLFGTDNILGKRIGAILGPAPLSIQVVGILENVRQDPTTVVTPPLVYLPLEQTTTSSVAIVLNAAVPPSSDDIKSRIWSLDPSQAVGETIKLGSLIDLALRRIRFMAFLMTLFATITILLSGTGIYAAVTQWLSGGQREIALRVAFGATYSQIIAAVILRIIAIASLALLAGAIAAFSVSNTIKSVLYGVQPSMEGVLVLAVLIVMAVTVLASYVPALRSKFVNPMQLLRAE